jgi:chromate reductase
VVTRVLLLSGSLRRRSTNTAVLRTAARHAPSGVEAEVYEGMAALPAFNPDDDVDPLPPPVSELRHRIWQAQALVFSTPEYAGDLPGSFKNLLDWTVGDSRVGSIWTKPVAWVNVATRGAAHAHESLRRVLGYVGAEIVEPACLARPVPGTLVGEDGLIDDPDLQRAVAQSLGVLAEVASGAPRPGAPTR